MRWSENPTPRGRKYILGYSNQARGGCRGQGGTSFARQCTQRVTYVVNEYQGPTTGEEENGPVGPRLQRGRSTDGVKSSWLWISP